MSEVIVGLMLAFLIGWGGGWTMAHKTVATDCERLGSFYVGDKVYHCNSIEERAK